MKKLIALLFLAFAIAGLVSLTACTGGSDDPAPGQTPGPSPTPVAEATPPPPPAEVIYGDPRLHRHGLELATVDGEEVLRFINTQPLTVAAWNRPAHERSPSIAASNWGQWIVSEMLRVHNVAVTLVEIPRWEPPEEQTLAALLAANTAPDVSYTFSMATIDNFAEMGGVRDITPIIAEYMDFIPNLYQLYGVEMLTWNLNHDTGQNWALTGPHPDADLRNTTFVREDWLEILGIAPPTTLDEFERMLEAFRDNAELLLGPDADQMVPFRLTEDVGWTGDLIFTPFIPDGITDRDWFIYGFDDRRFTQPGIKEGIRLLNRWYNNDLIWRDFSLHTGGDPRGNDIIRLGFVGSFSAGWDLPFRSADGLTTDMQDNVGPQANWLAIQPFPNNAGNRRQFVAQNTDRHIFFPTTNDNIAASLLYLDWLSRPSTRQFLMFGPEGITHHRTAEGAFLTIGNDYIEDDLWTFSIARNYDLLFVMGHSVVFGDPAAEAASLALGFPGIEPERVLASRQMNVNYLFRPARAVIPTPQAQLDFGSPGLNAQARAALNQAVVAPIDQFDAVFDAGMNAYLAMGGQQIIDARRAAWLAVYGDVDWVPAAD